MLEQFKDHKFRVASLDQIAKANSVLLHELYFDNMTVEETAPGPSTRGALKQRFGTLDRHRKGPAARQPRRGHPPDRRNPGAPGRWPAQHPPPTAVGPWLVPAT